jgi:hypothetical protein
VNSRFRRHHGLLVTHHAETVYLVGRMRHYDWIVNRD